MNRFIEGLSTSDRGERSQPAQLGRITVEALVRAGLSRAETVIRDHRVVVDAPADLPQVSVDPAAMTEVIYILLDNASKYAPRETAITVRAAREDDRHVRITVADEGPGIPSDLRERVFERFFRVPAREPLDPRRKGAGLGLPIARRLVEAQSGKIWLEGVTAARGTLAVLVLPAVVEAAEPAPAGGAANGENYDDNSRTLARAGGR